MPCRCPDCADAAAALVTDLHGTLDTDAHPRPLVTALAGGHDMENGLVLMGHLLDAGRECDRRLGACGLGPEEA